MEESQIVNAEVVSVLPNKIKILVNKLEDFQIAEEKLKVGSYVRIADNDNAVMLAVIENYSIESLELPDGTADRRYILETYPLGIIRDGLFERGGDTIAIPPKDVKPATKNDIDSIYINAIPENNRFYFSTLSSNPDITIPVDGNRFFNKHIAIVGSTGSGKSHTVAKILQSAAESKEGTYEGLNNSHIVLFDIHAEYKTAFPEANYLDVSSMVLPYWLLNSEELQELFIDTEANDHNQRNVFKEAVIESKRNHFTGPQEIKEKINFDTPIIFDIKDVLQFAKSKNEETVPGKSGAKQGPLYGKLSNFISRLENRINDVRLSFLLGEQVQRITFENTIKQFIGYNDSCSNLTIIDLSGIPFEVLSITVSLISRLLFEFGYYYKTLRFTNNPDETINNDVPLLLVYEEAHKYVPNSELSKYRASKESIERIAKEGRKYGVTLLLTSQRPSEISETIFSQCNNFIAMRLTNPNDQNYVKRLLPDTMGQLIDKLPTLKSGECLLIGDAVAMPSIAKIEECDPKPSSTDIPYFELWKQQWKEVDIQLILDRWRQ